MKKILSDQATFLLENKNLIVTGQPDLGKIKTDLENELCRVITLTITKQEGKYIEAIFTL